MGVVDFDPEKWSRANAPDERADVAKVARLAKVGGVCPGLSQLQQLSQLAPVPEPIRAGIAKLRIMKAPRAVRADCWPRVVTDAVGLMESGWAARALAKGWGPLQLFGAVTDPDGDLCSDGLAVWLAGRKITALLDGCIAVEDGAGRAYFNRHEQIGARLLWELGA